MSNCVLVKTEDTFETHRQVENFSQTLSEKNNNLNMYHGDKTNVFSFFQIAMLSFKLSEPEVFKSLKSKKTT